ncbi:MAG: repair protein SbcC/Rad50, partial [Actinomycetota bacterium]|nr:repair protein SbcC/Rad50 [Actinomycetota bacterium]
AAVSAAADAASEATALATARARSDEASAALVSLDEVRQEHDALVRDGKSVRAEVDAASSRVAALQAELASLSVAASELDGLRPLAEGLDEVESSLVAVRAAVAASTALAALPALDEPVAPDDDGLARATAEAASAKEALDTLAGSLQAAGSEVERARAQLARSATLSADEDCPVCGQSLGDAFASVQDHRRAELADAESRQALLAGQQAEFTALASAAADRLRSAAAAHRAATEAQLAYERHRHQRAAAEVTLADALALPRFPSRTVAGEPVRDGKGLEALAVELEAEVAERRAAARRLAQLEGALGRKPVAEAQLAEESDRLASAEGRRLALLDKVKGLAFDPAKLEALKAERDGARARAERAQAAADTARIAAERAQVTAEAEAQRLADAEAQHAALAEASESARHLGRMAELMNLFRTNVVATVGPRLSAQAAELFDELTDSEYDLLQVDPETYEIQIVDGGRSFGMDRFSGSETDLANLALRVAISEHVRFQSGGAVGLLVLDEVFGPLDDDRKERMLLALERLRARFGQVLVVTHASDIKESLPHAIQVFKLPGRRATARVVSE